MNRPVDAPAAEETVVRRIHDGIHRKRRNIAHEPGNFILHCFLMHDHHSSPSDSAIIAHEIVIKEFHKSFSCFYENLSFMTVRPRSSLC